MRGKLYYVVDKPETWVPHPIRDDLFNNWYSRPNSLFTITVLQGRLGFYLSRRRIRKIIQPLVDKNFVKLHNENNW